MTRDPLPQGITLRVWLGSEPEGSPPVFESQEKWLHPLFELLKFLEDHPQIVRSDLILKDRVIGRAAAFLILRCGIKKIAAAVVSRRALPLLETEEREVVAGTVVDRVDCQTEDQLAFIEDPEVAWGLLDRRRLLALASR